MSKLRWALLAVLLHAAAASFTLQVRASYYYLRSMLA